MLMQKMLMQQNKNLLNCLFSTFKLKQRWFRDYWEQNDIGKTYEECI